MYIFRYISHTIEQGGDYMATKTITNPVRFTSRKDSQNLLNALKSASTAKQKKIKFSKHVTEVSSVDVKKYAEKLK